MAVSFLDLSRQHEPLKKELLHAIEQVIDSSEYILGSAVARFEQNFAQRLKASHCVGVNSGTDALLLTLHALGIQPGDQVICPAFGYVAMADVIPRMGAHIVFADINEHFTIDVEHVRQLMNENTRAVIAAHMFGRMADVETLAQMTAEQGVHLIEDCSHACGAEINGRPAGTWGTAGAFSFSPERNLGCIGDGGAIVTNNPELAQRLRLYRDHGAEAENRYVEIGYNSRLDAIQAAILDVKLGTLDEDNADREANAAFYQNHLSSEVFALPDPGPEGSHVFNYYTIRSTMRDQLRSFLKDRMVDTRIYYPVPLHLQPCFEYLGYTEGHIPVAEQMAKEVLSLPVSPGLTRQELEEVAHTIDLFAQTYTTPTAG